MGARPEDYAVSAPYKSYIHVDDFDGPKELADYLHKLDQDDQEYNEYFKWKVRKLFMFKICSVKENLSNLVTIHRYLISAIWYVICIYKRVIIAMAKPIE